MCTVDYPPVSAELDGFEHLSDTGSMVPERLHFVRLFDPRRQTWTDHFSTTLEYCDVVCFAATRCVREQARFAARRG
jgi:hypothetical protein